MSMDMPALYIVTACKNAQDTLPDTFASLHKQSDEWTHYFVIDGASDDNSRELARDFALRHPGKVTVVSEPDSGIYQAMNKGISHALESAEERDLVAIVNADDYYLPDALSTMRRAAATHPEIDAFYGNCELMDEEGILTGEQRTSVRQLPKTPSCFTMPIEHPTMFARAKVYRVLGLYDESYRIAADYEWVLRLIEAQIPTQSLNRSITAFRAGGVSTTAIDASLKEALRARITHGASPLFEWARYCKQKTNERLYRWIDR